MAFDESEICPLRSTLNLFILTIILEAKMVVNQHVVVYDTNIFFGIPVEERE
jgi:hypothetical protein